MVFLLAGNRKYSGKSEILDGSSPNQCRRCVMNVGMIETRSLKMLLKSFHENYSDLFITSKYEK